MPKLVMLTLLSWYAFCSSEWKEVNKIGELTRYQLISQPDVYCTVDKKGRKSDSTDYFFSPKEFAKFQKNRKQAVSILGVNDWQVTIPTKTYGKNMIVFEGQYTSLSGNVILFREFYFKGNLNSTSVLLTWSGGSPSERSINELLISIGGEL